MSRKIIALLSFAALCIGCAPSVPTLGSAATSDLMAIRDARDADVRVGRFHADLAKAVAFAKSSGRPLMAVWSNGDFCSHCIAMDGALASPAFRSWMESSGVVFYVGLVYDGAYNSDGGTGPSPDGLEGYHGKSFYLCRNYDKGARFNFPYVRFYWPAGGVDEIYTGSAVDGEGRLLSAFPCSKTDAQIDAMTPQKRAANFLEHGDKGTYNPAGRFMADFITNGPFSDWFKINKF